MAVTERSTEDPTYLDLGQFSSRDEALAAIQRENGFDKVAKKGLNAVITAGGEMTLLLAFFQASVTRSRALYEGAAREAAHGNAHAVFTLIRQFAETLALVYYVADKPEYAKVVARRPRDRRPYDGKRKSPQALVDFMDRHHTAQFHLVYAELCEMTHFGAPAMWASHDYGEDGSTIRWSSAPQWRDDRQMFIACALLLELATGMEAALDELAHSCVQEVHQATQPPP